MGKIEEFMRNRAVDIAYAGAVAACKVSEIQIYGIKKSVTKALSNDNSGQNDDSSDNIKREAEKIVNAYVAMLILAAKVDGVDEEEQRLLNEKVNDFVKRLDENLSVTVSSLPKASEIKSFEDTKLYLDPISDESFLKSLWKDMGKIVNADGKISQEEVKLFEDYDLYLKKRFSDYSDSHEIYQHIDEAQIKEVESIFGEGV